MPIPAISLFGFLAEPEAMTYLANACVPANQDPVALKMDWDAARAILGAPTPNAGMPEIIDVPAAHAPHLVQVAATWPAVAADGWTVKLIEIDPLLAYQHHISLPQSQHHCGNSNAIPGLDELLAVCVPAIPPPAPPLFSSVQGQSIILRAEELNVKIQYQGPMNPGQFGIVVSPSTPLVQVVRCHGKCYLRNGFHRTYGMRRRGATHIPAIFKEANDYDFLGIQEAGGTFGKTLLESADPPTLRHFTQGAAYNVNLRKASRIIQINWSEHTLPDE